MIDLTAHRSFFQRWLIASTALTILGNAVSAVLTTRSVSPWLSIPTHIIPPALALTAVHAVALIRAEKRNALVAILSSSVVAGLAAAMSWSGLYELALLSGWHGWLAAAFPIVIDLGIFLSTVYLVTTPKPAVELVVSDNSPVVDEGRGDSAKSLAEALGDVPDDMLEARDRALSQRDTNTLAEIYGVSPRTIQRRLATAA